MRVRRRKNGPKGVEKRQAIATAYGRAVRSHTISDEPGGRLSNLQKAYIRRRIVDARKARAANPRRRRRSLSANLRSASLAAARLKPALRRRRQHRSPAQRRAFAKMLAGLRRSRAVKRRRNPIGLLAGLNSANPRRARRRNPKRKARTMARRRRSAAQRAAFRRMIAGLKKSKRRSGRSRKRRNPRRKGAPMARRKHSRRRRAARVVMINPRRRRRSRSRRRSYFPRRRRRSGVRRFRNPGGGIKAMLGQTFRVALPAVVGGGLSGYIDAKFLSTKPLIVRILAKFAEAIAAGLLLKRRPVAAAATMGAIIGSVGYEQGVSFAGGVVAGASPAAKAAGVQALVMEDPRAMGVLIKSMNGMGLQLDNNVSLGAPTSLDTALPPSSFVDVNLG